MSGHLKLVLRIPLLAFTEVAMRKNASTWFSHLLFALRTPCLVFGDRFGYKNDVSRMSEIPTSLSILSHLVTIPPSRKGHSKLAGSRLMLKVPNQLYRHFACFTGPWLEVPVAPLTWS